METTANPNAHSALSNQKLQPRDVVGRMDDLLLRGRGSLEEYALLVDLLRSQANSIPPNDADLRCMVLSTLGLALEKLYDSSGDIAHLQELIIIRQEALRLVSDTNIDFGSYVTDLANALARQWEKIGSIEHLDQAIAVYQDAVSRTSTTHRNRGLWENNLGNAFMWKYEKTQDIHALSSAADAYKNAVHSVSLENPNRLAYLRNLSSSLMKRYERQSSMDDLRGGIESLQDFVHGCGDDDHILPATLSNLGNLLQYMFDMTGSKDILLQALDANERAVKVSTAQDPNRGVYLSSVGIVYMLLYEFDGSALYLERAIESQREALKLLPSEYRGQSRHNLGNALLRQYEISHDSNCFDLAIDEFQDAVNSLTSDHFDRPKCLASLGIAAAERYKLGRSPEDIKLAVSSLELAVHGVQEDHPDRAVFLNSYGAALEAQFTDSKATADFDRIIKVYEDGAQSTGSSPTSRIIAARNAAKLLLFRDISKACEIYKLAVNLLPSVSPRTLPRSDQQSLLSEFAGLGSTAAALYLHAGRSPVEALQLQELGRGIMASLLFDTRSEITDLETSYPALSRRLREIRAELDAPMVWYTNLAASNQDQHEFQLKARRRNVVSLEFDQVLAEIREKEGFESFLSAPSDKDLNQLATRGPIVVFNISRLRCDAFLVTSKNISNLHLKDLHYDDILARVEVLQQQLRTSRSEIPRDARPRFYQDRREKMNLLLEWLWSVAAKPVLDQLGFTGPRSPSNPWPRVWWIATGALTLFPIHAASRRSQGTSESVLDRVQSSYIPTIKALSYARKKAERLSHDKIKNVLLVGMPTTPEMNPLPGVLKEIDYLEHSLPTTILASTLKLPKRSEVLSKLPSYQVVHFACHGDSDLTDPSASKLFLNDWQTAPLRVSDIVELNLTTAQFAYLSLCHAANSSDMTLLDESIHLASAFQLAGFPSIIATLWQIHDNQSARFAKLVYDYLLKENGEMDLSKVCQGVHGAMRLLRAGPTEDGVASNPFVWAPYIYIGP